MKKLLKVIFGIGVVMTLLGAGCTPEPGAPAYIFHEQYNDTQPTLNSPVQYGNFPSKYLDIYPAKTAAVGTIVYIHGGGFTGGTRGGTGNGNGRRDLMIDQGAIANQMYHGWNLVSIDYTLIGQPGGVFPQPLKDVVTAINWVRNSSGLAGSKLVVVGGSAGGTLAALVGAYNGKTTNLTGLGFNMPFVDGWLSIGAPLVDEPAGADRHFNTFMSGYPAANRSRGVPALNFSSTSAPGFAIHARRDGEVPYLNLQNAQNAAQFLGYRSLLTLTSEIDYHEPGGPLMNHAWAAEQVDANVIVHWFATLPIA